MKEKSYETNGDTSSKCVQIKKAGSRCNARRMENSEFCFFHDPARAKERTLAQRAGGSRNRAVALPSNIPDAPLADTRDVARLVADTINQVRRGEIDPKVANAVGYLAGILVKTLECSDLEARLEVLEAARAVKSEYGLDESME